MFHSYFYFYYYFAHELHDYEIVDDEIVEIMGVVALFGYLNRWNDVMATPLENDAALSAKELLASWDRGRH